MRNACGAPPVALPVVEVPAGVGSFRDRHSVAPRGMHELLVTVPQDRQIRPVWGATGTRNLFDPSRRRSVAAF